MRMISRESCSIAVLLNDFDGLLRWDPVLTAVVVVIHVLVSLLLIALILLHSGRGGGLSDMFGGAMGSAAAGSTVVERNLDRITVATAVVFAFTTTILAIRLQ
jgi:preprotein translocase subunit SecG